MAGSLPQQNGLRTTPGSTTRAALQQEQASLSIAMQFQTPRSNTSLVQPASSKGVNTTTTTHLPVTDCQNQAGETEMWQKYLEIASRLRTCDRFLCSFQSLHLPAWFSEWLRRNLGALLFLFLPILCFHLSPIG